MALSSATLIIGGLIIYVVANDASEIGVVEDLALVVLIPLFIWLGGDL